MALEIDEQLAESLVLPAMDRPVRKSDVPVDETTYVYLKDAPSNVCEVVIGDINGELKRVELKRVELYGPHAYRSSECGNGFLQKKPVRLVVSSGESVQSAERRKMRIIGAMHDLIWGKLMDDEEFLNGLRKPHPGNFCYKIVIPFDELPLDYDDCNIYEFRESDGRVVDEKLENSEFHSQNAAIRERIQWMKEVYCQVSEQLRTSLHSRLVIDGAVKRKTFKKGVVVPLRREEMPLAPQWAPSFRFSFRQNDEECLLEATLTLELKDYLESDEMIYFGGIAMRR